MRAMPSLTPCGERQPRDVLRISHGGRASRGDGVGPHLFGHQHFQRLSDLGVHLIEVDIHTTADDFLVVHHEKRVNLVSGSRLISELSYHELQLGLGNRAPTLLGEVLEKLGETSLGLYADIKRVTAQSAELLTTVVAEYGMVQRTVFASKDVSALRALGDAAPEIPKAVLFKSQGQDPVALAGESGAVFVHPCWEAERRPDRRLTARWLHAVRSNQCGVICWHEERPRVIKALFELGVDGICSDEPELLLRGDRYRMR